MLPARLRGLLKKTRYGFSKIKNNPDNSKANGADFNI